jgi:hypothetical protein
VLRDLLELEIEDEWNGMEWNGMVGKRMEEKRSIWGFLLPVNVIIDSIDRK